jgi:hypothetical protein
MAEQPGKLKPTAIGVPELAQLLTAVSGQVVDVAMLKADLVAGAPANADGTLNLVNFAAWLVKEMASGAD